MQRQTVEAAERAASEAKRARLEQENHCRQMERLKQAELDEQRNYVQFNKDVAFLEGESDEAKIDYILKRSLQGGSSNSFSAVHQAPLRNRLMGMLEERLELHPGIKRVSMAMAEQKSVWENAKSKLNSAESRIAQLTPVPTTGRYKLAALFGASGAIFVFWGVLLSLIYGAPPEDTSVVSLK
jgi:phage-related tail protein